jgi:hypothetical protein
MTPPIAIPDPVAEVRFLREDYALIGDSFLSSALGREVPPNLARTRSWVEQVDRVLSGARRRLDLFSSLAADWDSYGGHPPTTEALGAARRFLDFAESRVSPRFRDQLVPLAIVPTPVGGAQLEWERPSRSLEIEIGPDATFSVLEDRRHQTPRFREEHGLSLARALTVLEDFLAS